MLALSPEDEGARPMKSARAKPILTRWPLRRVLAKASIARRGLQRAGWFAIPLAILAGGAPAPLPVRLVGVVLVALGLAIAVALRSRPRDPPGGSIVVDPTGTARHRASGDARLVFWADRFGLVVLSNESRTRGL